MSARPTARQIVRGFLEERLDGTGPSDTGEMTRLARSEFMGDPEFVGQLARESFALMVSSELRRLARNRRLVRRSDLMRRGYEIVAKMYEHVGESVRKPIRMMTGHDLLFAANERERMAAGTLKWSAFERELASLLPDLDTPNYLLVDDETFEALWDKHFED